MEICDRNIAMSCLSRLLPCPLGALMGAAPAARQAAAATQFIVEEKYLARYRVPALLAVGLEGFWGLLISLAALPALGALRGPDGRPLDSLPQALRVRPAPARARRSWRGAQCAAGPAASWAVREAPGASITCDKQRGRTCAVLCMSATVARAALRRSILAHAV